jgi:phosphate transport system substrate-binding protein
VGSRPIHLYGLKPVNGIEQYFKVVAMDGGEYKDNIQFVKKALRTRSRS